MTRNPISTLTSGAALAAALLLAPLAAPAQDSGADAGAAGRVAAATAGASAMALVGQATYRVAFIPIYDAALFAPAGDFDWEAPFALTLTYRRSLKATAIADRSIVEMAKVTERPESDFAPLRETLTDCFSDVTDGDRLTGYSHGPDAASFFVNGEKSCDVSFPGFREAFFGIWLSSQSPRPELTEQLIAEAPQPVAE